MKRLIGCTAVLCLAALLAALTVGCGGTASSGIKAYVANSTGTGFTVFTVSQQGPLTNPTQQNTPAPPKMLQISANGKWAFFLDASGNNIYGFTRAGNGNFVDPITGSPFALTSSGSSIAITPNNKFVYAAIPATNEIAIFIIDQSTGQLTQLGSNKPVGAAIRQLAVAPDGLALYGLAPDQQEVLGFLLDTTTGAATPSNSPGSVGPAPPCHGPNPPDTCEGMILSSDGNFIYVPDTVQTSPFVTHASGGVDIAGNSPVIYGFSTKGNGVEGSLQPIPGVIFNENADVTTKTFPTVPVAGATSPNGRWLFIANQGSSNISVFDIHTLGGGAPLEVIGTQPSPFDCGSTGVPAPSCTAPSFIAVSNQNNAIYVLDTAASRIFQLAVDQSTGRLRLLDPPSVDAGATPTWITLK